jgi:hypothetical protein
VIVYFAGNVAGHDHSLYAAGVRSKLLTFAEIDDWGKLSFAYWIYNKPHDVRIFMDSGAFSAFMRGAIISLDRYMRFCQDNAANLETIVQLDRIGDPETTKKNLAIMESEGLKPIPVFTSAAPLSELERLCERYHHIALGGLRGKEAGTVAWRRRHFDKVFAVAQKYWPVKFHAFGITGQWVLERYPFYSVDSSSAIVGGGMGRIMSFKDGRLDSEPWIPYVQREWEGLGCDIIGETGHTTTQSAHMGRRISNIGAMLDFEKYINDLWRYKAGGKYSWETDIPDPRPLDRQ